jgi:pyruvate,water dikinase
LVKANDHAHRAMSEMGEMIVKAEPFSQNYADNVYYELIENTRIIIENLILMSGGKYQTLRKKLEHIENVSEEIFHPNYFCPDTFDCREIDCTNCPKRTFFPEDIPYYYDISEIDKSKYLEVGDKMSRLGEIRNVLGLPVPDGFSLTVRLFEEILAHNNLRSRKEKLFAGVDYSVIAQIRRAVKETRNLFMWNPLPPHIREIILNAYNTKYGDKDIKLAVRSSALGEDSDKYSFAGLHHTELNVSREKFVDAVYDVLISKYSPESVVYRFINGLRDEDMPMSVCCLEMVDTVAAGVLFTADPNGEKNGVIIQAVRGLGVLVVEGRVTPQEYLVEHNENATVLSFNTGEQSYRNIPAKKDGLFKDYLSAEESEIPCLTNEQVRTLIKYALKIEKHFGGPQDIEWALDRNGKIFIIQARPLNVKKKEYPIAKDFDYAAIDEKYRLLLTKGDTASPGIASGPVRFIRTLEDFVNFPENGIIVAKKNIPEFASLIHKASGVVTDFGSTTGHLSIIARELGVPILTNTYNATEILQDGMLITIDTVAAKVYDGAVEELIKFKDECESSNEIFRSSPLYNIWHRLSKYIFKLNLYNPDAQNFNALGCETLHDIIRFSHESAIRLMFGTSQAISADRGKIYNLRFGLPLDIYIIDLKDGLKDNIKTDWVTPDDILSKPFRALLKGMTTPGLKWAGHLPIDTKGFFSIIVGNIVDESRNDSEIGARSYAMISENYFNFFSRLGYHFSRIDCFASDEPNSNYINFNFRGGAADMTRKVRRITAIKLILEHYGFTTDVHDDNVIARIRKIPKELTYEYVAMLGRLMGSIRNTDVSMVTNRQVELFVKYFLDGDPTPGLKLADSE